MNVARFLGRRLLLGAVVMAGLSIVIFVVARIIPGDAARLALGSRASQEQVEIYRERLHLNDSIPVQYWEFLKGLLHGDLGESTFYKSPVAKNIVDFLPATLELVLAAGMLMVAVGVPLGVIAARYRDGAIDNVARLVALLGVISPSFVWAVLLMLLFSHTWGLLPVAGRLIDPLVAPPHVSGMYTLDAIIAGDWSGFWDALSHLILPAIALAFAGIGQAARLTRANMVETYGRQYIEMARAFNVPERVIAFKYALKPAMIPTLTILGLDFSVMLGSAFLVEIVFNWPGLARYGVYAMMQKDLNAIVGTVLVIGAMFVVVNIIVDLLVAFLNPRIRFQGETR